MAVLALGAVTLWSAVPVGIVLWSAGLTLVAAPGLGPLLTFTAASAAS